tara:strand:- start:290 stop:451 length:162 start_codon:yes stop_codon:yes gene_type:complete
MELSDIIFWISVFIALYGGKWFADKARKNNLEGYEDEDCGCKKVCTINLEDKE